MVGAAANQAASRGVSCKSFATDVRVEDTGASGAEELTGADLEMQHGQRLVHEASQEDLALVGADAKALPDDTTRLAASTTSQRAISIIVVFACFISTRGLGGPRSYFFGASFLSAASIFFTYLAASFLKSSRQPLQQSFTSRPS